MKALLDFIKYNNAVPIALAVVILGAGVAFAASPELRRSVLPEEPVPSAAVSARPADVTLLLSLNLEKYDIAVRIDGLVETTDAYLVDYSYNTYDIVAGVWQEARKAKHLDIPKALLGKRSLTDYLSEQLGQVSAREIAYLGEVQGVAAGEADARKDSKYVSLVGKELKTGDGTPSYTGTGVKEGTSASEASGSGVKSEKATSAAAPAISDAKLREMIVQAVSDFLAIDTSMPVPTVPSEPTVVAPDTEDPVIEPAPADTTADTPAETTPEEEPVADVPAEEVGE